MEQFIPVQGTAMLANGQGVKQPETRAGEMLWGYLFTPGDVTGFSSLVAYHYGTPPCWRQMWIASQVNGEPLPGNVMINPATGKPFVPGAINGVSMGMDPVSVNVYIGNDKPTTPPGYFSVPPVWLRPSTGYIFALINRYGGPGGPWPTTSCYTKFYPPGVSA